MLSKLAVKASYEQPVERPASDANRLEAVKASAVGQAQVMTADVQQGPSGDTLVMKSSATEGEVQRPEDAPQSHSWASIAKKAAPTLAYRGAQVAAAIYPELAWMPKAVQGVSAAGGLAQAGEGGGSVQESLIKSFIPGGGVLSAIESGAPYARDIAREKFGINIPEPQTVEGPQPGTLAALQRDLGWGGVGTTSIFGSASGLEWGTAAAQGFNDGVKGTTVGTSGVASTSYGVAPRSAPAPTGGDTPTEA